MSGAVSEAYVAAIQHDLADLDGAETLVGVVREPAGWFHATVDENQPELGPPTDLLAETKQRAEDLQMQGLCEEGAHNAAWDETDFESRYLAHLDDDEDAQRALEELAARVADGEDVALVCFEGDRKRCHRTLLRGRLLDRLETA
ncbi:DUF488 domain-containing protein [Haloarcula salinisoli]|uniref:DUF488 domain-containing protein n=1 Tax=Haloarcula salinisoli TaxID=2487746 RepID=A0A8J8C6Y1_9EURY|nr:DUF488 domain-containing protein [Halomicroarcula salinisoli]MBX0302712.1 DUF488 domain-containing protein [Halomicroarcula salinisoli]